MRKSLTIVMILACLSFGFAQGLQGNATLSGSARIDTGHSVTLTWNASPNATSYNLYRGTVSGGPYVRLASGIAVQTFTDTQIGHRQTLYYVITAVNAKSESAYSSQVAAVIP